MIKGYQTDNGIFNSSEFIEELLKKQKNIRFNGMELHTQMEQQSAPSNSSHYGKDHVANPNRSKGPNVLPMRNKYNQEESYEGSRAQEGSSSTGTNCVCRSLYIAGSR